jgi:hypothetical protein
MISIQNCLSDADAGLQAHPKKFLDYQDLGFEIVEILTPD